MHQRTNSFNWPTLSRNSQSRRIINTCYLHLPQFQWYNTNNKKSINSSRIINLILKNRINKKVRKGFSIKFQMGHQIWNMFNKKINEIEFKRLQITASSMAGVIRRDRVLLIIIKAQVRNLVNKKIWKP